MTFLPLHAAGDYSSRTQPKAFDYVISSYTPTLTALLSCNPYTFNNDCRIIAVDRGNTNSHPELRLGLLPRTDRQLELVKDRTQGRLIYSQLVGPDATQERVLEAMSQNNWVHLACHTQQDSNDPAKSGFLLHESTLDLVAIARRLFNNKGLAFLSVCQTAAGDDNLADEAAHLASCMLVTGYPTVVASMWSVIDEDAPLVTDGVYHHLMNDRSITNGEVARALHYAVAALRERVGMTNFDRWVQYIHMGL
jgi:CHAT domain-containing protein